MFVNGVKLYQFETKNSEINTQLLCFGIISKDFPVDNIKNTGPCECLCDFSVDYDTIYVDYVLDICKYLMKMCDIK